jgi:hypothetical protein
VSLDVLPADVPADYAPAMVSACSDALIEGGCAMASSLPESTQPEAVALVLWQGSDFLRVTVRVGRGRGQWVARALTFSERDSIPERWTTVGLTVATLVGETRQLDGKAGEGRSSEGLLQAGDGHGATPTLPAREAAPKREMTPAAQPPVSQWRGRLGVLTGPGWDSGRWQVGGWLSLGFRLPSTPVVLHAAGSYALSEGPNVEGSALSTRWATVGVGAGLTGTLAALDVAGSAELEVAFRRVDADFRGHRTGDQELPVRLRAMASFPARGVLAATSGVVLRLPPGNPNESSGLHLNGPAFSAEVIAGLEVRL